METTLRERPMSEYRLSDDEIARFHRDGYIVPRYRLDQRDLAELQRLTEKIVADNPDRAGHPMVCPHVPGNVPELLSPPGWRRFATDPVIVDMVSQLLGEDLILWGTSLFYKQAHKGPSTPWHRDGTAPVKPLITITAWIAVFDSMVDNGCLRCIPGSHQSQQVGKHTTPYFDLQKAAEADTLAIQSLDMEEFDEDTAVDVELSAGQIVLFDSPYLVHGARSNTGSRPRGGYALRFMPSTSYFDHAAAINPEVIGRGHDSRPLILVRGTDRSGRNDFRRGHPAV
jgi:chlorinating enzyme